MLPAAVEPAVHSDAAEPVAKLPLACRTGTSCCRPRIAMRCGSEPWVIACWLQTMPSACANANGARRHCSGCCRSCCCCYPRRARACQRRDTLPGCASSSLLQDSCHRLGCCRRKMMNWQIYHSAMRWQGTEAAGRKRAAAAVGNSAQDESSWCLVRIR